MTTFAKIHNKKNFSCCSNFQKMVEGKESVLYALPFCAGTVTGIFLCGHEVFYSGVPYSTAMVSVSASAGLAAASVSGAGGMSRETRTILVIAAVFFCGMFCWSSHSIIGFSDNGHEGRGIIASVSAPAATWLKSGIDSLPLRDYGSNALIKALVTGDQSDVPADVKTAFRDSGASHILALSGMHLAIIYLILTKILSVLGQSRKADIVRFVTIVCSTLFYSVMTGSSPSIIRAFLFILLRETAILTGRKTRPVNILCFALTVQCALDPGVITSASFQLSYLAMCGIYFVYPVLRDLYPAPVPVLKKVWNSAAMSISCQAFTGPLAWLLFGSAPVYFIITNLIAVPITSALMPVALVAIFLYRMDMCPDILLRAIDFSTELVIRCLEIICTLP